ncbi:MAG: response regulator transcription factor [Castellaniella sp.]|nr:MAG: response regulator transcription factor [Castellaniella sp.]
MIELVSAAQQGYTPNRILLLSDTQTLPYSVLNLPPMLAGYISKYSSQDVLKTSIMLVLAGGKCFPHPDMFHQAGAGEGAISPDCGAPPKRRWYDRHETPTSARIDEPQPDNLLHHPKAAPAAPKPQTELRQAELVGLTTSQALTPDLISREADMLHLTPRQYEVLALLAKGFPLKKISRELNISIATAKTHTEALYQRLSVNNRNAAVYAAVSRGATLGWHESHVSGP